MSTLVRPLIVIGKHRSGTSAVTLALRELGIYLGPEQDIFQADSFNEDGNLENIRISQLNQQLSSEFEVDGTSTGSVTGDWLTRPGIDGLVDSAGKFLSSYFAGMAFWGWKDPRTTLLLPVYLDVFRRIGVRPHFVMPVRHPLDVAKSMERRDGVSQNVAVGLWIHFVLSALHDLEPGDLTVFSYEAFLTDPRTCLEPALSELQCSKSEVEGAGVRKVVRADLNHGKGTLDSVDIAPEILGRVYSLVQAIVSDPGGYKAGGYRPKIEALWSEWQMLGEVRMAHLRRSMIRFWWPSSKVEAGSETHVTMASREWQTAQVPLEDLGEGYLHLALVPPGMILYLRKPEFVSGQTRVKATSVAAHGAYPEVLEDGTIRLLTHGKDEHAMFQAPSQDGPWEFQFEYQIDSTSRASRYISSLLSGEAIHLRSKMTTRP